VVPVNYKYIINNLKQTNIKYYMTTVNLSNFFSISSFNVIPMCPSRLSCAASTLAANVLLVATSLAAFLRKS